jgi:hypothetical protein
MAASGSTGSPNYLPYPLDTDPVDVAGDVELLALQTSGRLNTKVDNVLTTLGDILYASANGSPYATVARLAGNTSTTRSFLGQTGTGSISAPPSWTSSTGTGNVVLATSATITTPTILDILATTTATADLWSEVTTGSITIGAGLTTGTLNIAAAGTGATTINLGHTNATLNIVGAIDIPIISAVALGTNASGVIAAATTSGTGSTIVLQGSPTITSPTIDSIINTSVSTAATYFNGITTGSITTGGALTTGAFNIANGTAIAGGSVNIGSGAGTGNKTIAIGTSATAGTTAVTIGSNSGATSTIALNGTVTVGGDMTINGTLTTINSNSLTIDDKNIELGSVTAGTVSTTGTVGSITGTGPWTATITGMTDTADLIPGSAITATNGTGSLGGSGTYIVASIVSNTSITYTATGGTTPVAGTVTNISTTGATDVTANGGGMILKGTTDKTILWDSTNSNWTASEHINLVTGKVFKINNVQVLSNTAVLGITPTTNATGFTLSGGTTAVAVTFAGGAAYTISGTNGQTYTLPTSGGTLIANPMTTLGDIIYGGASGAPTRLAGSAVNGTYFLRENVTASASVAPDWVGSTGSGNVVLATSPTLTGTPLSTTAAADTNTTQIATTAFVVGQASAVNPSALGSVAIGTSLRYARADHVHPTTGLALLAGATFTGQIQSTLAWNAADNAGQIYLNGATGNRIDFNANGVAAPTFTTRSAGTKIVLSPAVAAAAVDYGIGIEASNVWFSTATTSTGFKFYGGTTNSATLTGAGALTLASSATATSFIPSGSTIPTNGMYLPAANSVAFATNSGGSRIYINSNGNVGIGVDPSTSTRFAVAGSITGSIYRNAVFYGTVASDVTGTVTSVENAMYTQATAFTLSTYNHFLANEGLLGAGSAITTQNAFVAGSNLTSAGTNIGFRGQIPSASQRWNLYMDGTAANYLAGQTTINSTSLTLGNNGTANSTAQQFSVVAANAGTVVQVIRAAVSQTANITEWQNSSGGILSRILNDGSAAFSNAVYTPSISNPSTGSNSLISMNAGGTKITTAVAGNIALTIQNTAGTPTANLTEWQTPTPTTPTWVDQNAVLNTSNTPTSNTQVANKAYVDTTVANQAPEIIPIDDISNYFDGTATRFAPLYQGEQVSILNPLRLLLTINGIIQYVDFPEYVWMSGVPRRGFFVDSDGYLQFSESVPAGSEFDGRVMSGSTTTTRTRVYPFRALDILLGG